MRKKTANMKGLLLLLIVCLLGTTFGYSVSMPAYAQQLPLVVDGDVYEAEDGDISNGEMTGIVEASHASNGYFVRLGVDVGEYNQINNVNGYDGGSFELTIRYTNGAGGINTKALYVNGDKVGDIQFVSTSPNNDWSNFGELKTIVELDPGSNNTIRLINEATTEYPLRLDAYRVEEGPPQPEHMDTYEAEDGIIVGDGAGTMNLAGASNGLVARTVNIAGNYNEITNVDGYDGGDYQLTVRYVNGHIDNMKELYVNGVKISDVMFPPTGSWSAFGEISVVIPLNAGNANTFKFVNAQTTVAGVYFDIYTVATVMPYIGTTYYVDSVGGNDFNSGTNINAPWKTLAKLNAITFRPNDQILLKAGSVWNGEGLVLKGSGTEESPIILGKYGEGHHPRLNGDGQVNQLVYLRNVSYWTVENLEITNTAEDEFVHTLMGIRVEAIDAPNGVVSGITLRNLYLHSVNGIKGTGIVQYPALIYFNSGGTITPSKFDNVLVKDSVTMDSIPNGLNFYSSNTSRGGPYSTNVHIDNVSGNLAQIYWMLDGAIIENNRLVNVGSYKPQYSSTVFAAIFPTYSQNMLFQYNEIINTAASGDSQGFDFDYHLKGTNIFQYNYTYGNAGTLLVMNQSDPDVEMIYRYNVSHNDGASQFRLGDSNVLIYNNVIYNPHEEILISTWGEGDEPNRFYNNIFVGKGMQIKAEPGRQEPIFDYNVFYGFPGPKDAHKINSDPLFEEIAQVAGLSSIDGFRLSPNSPALNTGKVMAENGGKDILGGELYFGGPDRGAIEHQGTALGGLYEAESGTLSGGAQIGSDTAASSGQYVSGLDGANASIVINNVNGGRGGEYRLEVMYSANSSAEKSLYVNGVKAEVMSFAADFSGYGGVVTAGITLNEGSANSISIQNDESTAGDVQIDRLLLEPISKVYEAENGEFGEGAVEENGVFGAWSDAIVKTGTGANGYSRITGVDGYDGGVFEFKVRYANGHSADSIKGLYVNGYYLMDVTLEPTGVWSNYGEAVVSVPLGPGNANTVMLANDAASPYEVYLDGYTVVRRTSIYEAQNGMRGGGAVVRNNTDASGWNVVYGLELPDAFVSFHDVFAMQAGAYRIHIRYSGVGSGVSKGLYVNGVKAQDLSFASTGDLFDFDNVTATVQLNKGMNSVEIRNDNSDAGVIYLDKIEVISDDVLAISMPVPPPPFPDAPIAPVDIQFIEVEKTEIAQGGPAKYAHPDTSGGAFVSSMHYSGRYVIWNNVNGGAGGNYTLNIGYRTGNNGAKLGVYVNGVRQGTVDFANTGWVNFSETSFNVTLPPGFNNSIMLKNDEMPGNVGVGLDYFQLVREGVQPPPPTTPEPGPNVLDDPGFEEGGAAWTLGNYFTITEEDKYSGEASLKVSGTTGANSGSLQRFNVDSYYNYTVSFYAKFSSDRATIRVLGAGGGILGERTASANNEWTLYTINFNARNNTELTLYIGLNGEGTFYFDDFSIHTTSDIPLYPNLISNGDFDVKSTQSWTVGEGFSLSYADKYTGTSSIRLHGTGGEETLSQTLKVTAGTDYVLSFMSKAPAGNTAYKIRTVGGADVVAAQTVATSEMWTLHTLEFNSLSNTQLVVEFVDAASGIAYIDEVQVKRQVAS